MLTLLYIFNNLFSIQHIKEIDKIVRKHSDAD